jgi:hypothetical protein
MIVSPRLSNERFVPVPLNKVINLGLTPDFFLMGDLMWSFEEKESILFFWR